MPLSRRSFLTALGASAAGIAALRALGQELQSPAQALQEWGEHAEEFRVSICQQCPGGCGILARVVDGNLVQIAGNPLYPVNEGGICMKGLAGSQVLYDPDRIRSPLEREGPRGAGRWKPIAWGEALARVAARLQSLRQAGQAHTVAVLGGQYRGLVDDLFGRFCRAYGTPNYLRLRCLDFGEAAPSAYYMQGLQQPLAYDLARSRYIISFGCNLLESWISPVHQQKLYGRLHDHPGGEHAQVVMVDPRYSVTAAKADLWLPLHPGTDAALALGLAHIIIQEGRYDTDFVREKSFGFEDWADADGTRRIGFKTLVLEDYPPEKVAAVTGVPVERLFQVARSFASTRPAVALGERGPAFQGSDLYTRMAVHSLNALVGSIGRPGGIVRQGTLPLTPWPRVALDDSARAGLGMPSLGTAGEPALDGVQGAFRLHQRILAHKPYALNALLLYCANPLFSLPERQAWAAALEQVPFIVSFSPFMDETTQQADLILPDCTYLERWRDDEINHLAGITCFGIGAPVVPPLHDTRATEDVLLQLAHELGAPMAAAMRWARYSDVLREKARGLYATPRGHILLPREQEQFEAILARQGYWQPTFDSFDAFWDELLRTGAWWDPNDTYVGPRQLLRTPSRKFEFYSQLLRRRLEQSAWQGPAPRDGDGAAALERLAGGLGIQAQGDRRFLPHDEALAPGTQATDYPYVLNTYKLMSLAGGKGANQPWLQQEPAVHLDGGWDSWVEINPETAAQHGIADDDPVWLESPAGRIRVRARIFPGTAPQVLNMPYGWGHLAYGRWARNRGQNPNDVLEARVDPLRGVPAWAGTRVRLTKA